MEDIVQAEDLSPEEWDDIVRDRLTERQALDGLKEVYEQVVDGRKFPGDVSQVLKSMQVVLIRQNDAPPPLPPREGFWNEALSATTSKLQDILHSELDIPREIAELYSVGEIAHRFPGSSKSSRTCSSGECVNVCC